MKKWHRCACALVLLAVLAVGCTAAPASPATPTDTLAPQATLTGTEVAPTATTATTETESTEPAASATATKAPAPAEQISMAWRTITEVEPGFTLTHLISLMIAPDGALWVGSDNDGLYRYDGSAWRRYARVNGLADGSVHHVATAPDGTLWAVTWFGVSRLQGERWRTFTFESDFVGNDLHSLAIGLDGVAWVGSGRGLLRQQGEGWEPALAGTALANQGAYALWMDPEGALWVAATDRNLYRVQDGEATPVGPADLPEGTRINVLLGGPDGGLWVGTSRGVYRYADGAWQTPAEGLPEGSVTSLALAPDGTLWIGTLGQGLLRYDGQGAQRYTVGDGLPGSDVYAVAVDNDGMVWAAMAEGLAVGERQ